MNIKISIITVTYNSAATLEQTIQSVVSQTYSNIEYIIVDGLSTDSTLNIVEKYRDKISKLVSEKDQGLYDAINKGIALANGDVVGILHSDDFYTHNRVIEEYATMFEKGSYDGVYADLYYVDKDDTDKIVRTWKSGAYNDGDFLNGWMPPHPTFFVKRNCYKQFGNFSLEFKTAADYELMLRFIHKQKIKLGYLNSFTVKMRTGGKSNANVQSRLNANREDRRAWEMNGLSPRFYTLYLKPFRKILQFIK